MQNLNLPVLGINQPYFLPYLGYFSLIQACDHFIIYDNVKFSKGGWVNRNRILRNGEVVTITVPLRAGSDSLQIAERKIAEGYSSQKLFQILEGAYRESPFWPELSDYLPRLIEPKSDDLFEFLERTIQSVCKLLNINTEILRYSNVVRADFEGAGVERIFETAKILGSKSYLNLPGGRFLYNSEEFGGRGLELIFLDYIPFAYPQVGSGKPQEFQASLSILDLLANIGVEQTSHRVRTDFRLTPGSSALQLM